MKKILNLIALACLGLFLQSCIVSQKPNVSFFSNPAYQKNGARFTSINVPMFLAKPIVRNSLRKEGDREEMINLLRKVSDIKVLTIENSNQQIIADFTRHLKNARFEDWMTVRKENEVINFQAKQKGNVVRNLLITISSGNELVLVDLSGKFTADDISKMINYSEKHQLNDQLK